VGEGGSDGWVGGSMTSREQKRDEAGARFCLSRDAKIRARRDTIKHAYTLRVESERETPPSFPTRPAAAADHDNSARANKIYFMKSARRSFLHARKSEIALWRPE